MSNANPTRELLTTRFRVAPEPFWAAGQMRGDDGYDRIDAARPQGWDAIPSWGRDGWDLGSWPLVVIYHRHTKAGYELAECVEGDLTVYRYPTKAQRDAATDQIAFFHWQYKAEPWVAGIRAVADAPDRLRGAFSWARGQEQESGVRGLD